MRAGGEVFQDPRPVSQIETYSDLFTYLSLFSFLSHFPIPLSPVHLADSPVMRREFEQARVKMTEQLRVRVRDKLKGDKNRGQSFS